MKLVTAIVQPFTLSEVRAALERLGVLGMTMTEVQGFGQQRGQTESHHRAEYATEFVRKVKIEIVVRDGMLDPVLTTVARVARTGTIGDGKIWVTPVEQTIRVRTGERDEEAL